MLSHDIQDLYHQLTLKLIRHTIDFNCWQPLVPLLCSKFRFQHYVHQIHSNKTKLLLHYLMRRINHRAQRSFSYD